MLVGGTMVGDLEDVDRWERRMGPQQPSLGRWFEVAEKQQGGTALDPYEQRDAGVVGSLRDGTGAEAGAGARDGAGAGAGAGPEGCPRPQDLPGERPDPAPLPRSGADHGHPGHSRRSPYEFTLVPRLVERRRLHRTDGPAPQHAGQPPNVVRVEMRQKDQRNPGDAQFPQTSVGEFRVGARVHDDGRAGTGRQHRGIALPDIAHRERPARRRPAGDHPGERGRAQHGEQEQQRAEGGRPGMPWQPAGQEHDQGRDCGQQQTAAPAARPARLRPRQRRTGASHGGDPPGGPPRAARQQLGDRHGHRGRGESGEPENRGRGDRELGNQIARDRHQTDSGREDRHDGSAHGLRRGGRGQRLGEPWRHPSPLQRRAPAGADGEQSARGEDGEQKAVTPGEPRVVQDEQQYGRGQRRDQRPAASGADGEQGDGPAGRGPQDARLGPAHNHERERERATEQGRPSQRDTQPGCETPPFGQQSRGRRPDQQDEHDGQIASGYGKQVREVGRLEGVLQLGRDP